MVVSGSQLRAIIEKSIVNPVAANCWVSLFVLMTAYQEKLLHPKWQKKKADILERDGYKCRSCGREDITLHAHHTIYIEETEPWDYKDDSLITLCEVCHNTEHLIGNLLRSYLIELIKENPLLIHLVAQMCVLTEKVPEFTDRLRKFLKIEMNGYYENNRANNGKEIL